MGRKPKDAYASEDELAWFDLQKYGELKSAKDSKGNAVVNYGLWATVIRDRVELLRFLAVDMKDYVIPLFEKIKLAPMEPLGFSQRYTGAISSSDTPTVKSITTNRVKWLHDAMIRTGADERSIVDDQLVTDTESAFGDYAHIMVNLRSTNTQLCTNFKSWLIEWRKHSVRVTAGDYRQKIDTWAQANIVPYMDLELFALVTGKSIDGAKKFKMLFPKSVNVDPEAQRKRRSNMKTLVFTNAMALIVEHLAENEPSGFRTKTGGQLSTSKKKRLKTII